MQFATREDEDLDIFRGFMTSMMEQNLQNEITTYLESIGNEESRDKTQKKVGRKSQKVGRKSLHCYRQSAPHLRW